MKETLVREVELGEDVKAVLQGSALTIKGPRGEVTKSLSHPRISLTVEGNKVVLRSQQATKKEKKVLCSFKAHIINLVQGVREPHLYKLKICSGHFPMNVAVAGRELVIKNFFGESVPRRLKLSVGVEVRVQGSEITVSSPDKELAGQAAASIENLCRITHRDLRVFQDGCYIIHKAGKDL